MCIRDSKESLRATQASHGYIALRGYVAMREGFDLDQDEALGVTSSPQVYICLLYTSDAADERSSVDLGGRRIIKKKNTQDIAQATTLKHKWN